MHPCFVFRGAIFSNLYQRAMGFTATEWWAEETRTLQLLSNQIFAFSEMIKAPIFAYRSL